MKELETGEYESFEFASWTLITKERKIFMSCIYRTPYSTTHPITTTKFFDDFSKYLSEKAPTHGSILITGDFNIHHEDLEDTDKLSFSYLLNTFGYKQLVKCITHISGCSIDLILTREQDNLIMLNPEQSQLLSDHYFVRVILNIKCKVKKQMKITCKNISKIDTDLSKKVYLN